MQIVPDDRGHLDRLRNPVSSGHVRNPTSSILFENFQGFYSGSRNDKMGRLRGMMSTDTNSFMLGFTETRLSQSIYDS